MTLECVSDSSFGFIYILNIAKIAIGATNGITDLACVTPYGVVSFVICRLVIIPDWEILSQYLQVLSLLHALDWDEWVVLSWL